MAKRFIDTKIWDKQWFRQLELRKKLLWLYITTKCDHAGIWDADFEAATFFIGEKVTDKDLDWMKNKMVTVKSNNGQKQYFFPSFVDYQYGYLKETSKPHLSVRKRLTDKGLGKFINKGLNKNLKSSLTLKDKDKDKDKKKSVLEVENLDKVKRGDKFALKVTEIAADIPLEGNIVCQFVNYWTESNTNGRKMRFEMEKTFDIKRRLIKWRDNNNEWARAKKYKRQKLSI